MDVTATAELPATLVNPTVQDILDAYARNNLKPTQGVYLVDGNQYDEDAIYACALGALYYDKTHEVTPFLLSDEIADLVHMDHEFAEGIITGFDSPHSSDDTPLSQCLCSECAEENARWLPGSLYLQGKAVGRAVALAIFPQEDTNAE